MRRVYSIILFSILICFSNAAAEWSIFLLIGQSNMAGQGSIETIDKVKDERVKVMAFRDCSSLGRTSDEWYTAEPPLHDCYEGVGPGDWFAKTLLEKGYPDTIALVPVSISGASIDLFVKGSYYSMQSYQYNPPSAIGIYPSRNVYPWVVERLNIALQKGKLKGILFHQGESDTGSQTWISRVKKLVADLKADLDLNEDVPFIAGELPYNGCCSSHNSIIAQIPNNIPNSAVVSASGLTDMKDQYHFNTAAYRDFGARYAEAFLKLSPIQIASSSSSLEIVSSSSLLEVVSSSSNEEIFSSSSTLALYNQKMNTPLRYSFENYSLIVNNAVLGTPYFVSDLQGNIISHGIANSSTIVLKQQSAGVYLFKMGESSKMFIVK